MPGRKTSLIRVADNFADFLDSFTVDFDAEIADAKEFYLGPIPSKVDVSDWLADRLKELRKKKLL